MTTSKLKTAIRAVKSDMLTPSQAAQTFGIPKRKLYDALRQSDQKQQTHWQKLMQEKANLERSLAKVNRELYEKFI
ncbi:hypothetical protein HUZ36_02640 [Pseudoalteromonas sp. McH1-7]|uniref:helix-turn-helix domain-containing protein n=1 Tax=Pseudoalteromonas TaxID=53246 RepID=UPI0015919CFE|nr:MULTISPECIES: helix-turn-helix domain-containing protein [Pseudoalteromonas]MDW7547647.1 hypothetical protein [Pseudoalteromonas peptidolytica]NUZ09671.1 hypothetical protein [Pseudoalteromonas sp. McH1-7]